MNISCSAEPCPIILDCSCVFYSGANLIYTGINTNDTLCNALYKIDQKFKDASIGYVFQNGLIQIAPGSPVKIGGTLIENTVITSGPYTFALTGTIESTAFITTGGTAAQFVKGDGTLDNNVYQIAGNYITDLYGDGTATGPGSSLFTLSNTGVLPNTYGSATKIPIITVDAKGRITWATSTTFTVPPATLNFTGDVTGFGQTNSTIPLTLATVLSTPGTYGSATTVPVFTVNGKGLITGITQVPVATSSGTVTSVGVTAGTGISASVANPTTTPNITITNTAPDKIVVLNNGTGINTSGTYPNFTITNTAPDQTVVLSNGTGISTSGTYPSFTITNTAPDQIVSLVSGTGISVTGTYPNFTITATGISGVSAVTASSPLASSGGATPNITIQQASGSQGGYLSSGDWTTFNSKEPAIAAGTTAQYWRGDKTWQTFPTIPTVGTWGALNYPTWTSGTPFVKMTAAGTFALDTTSYQPLLTNPVTGTGTATQVAFWDTSSSVTGDSQLYWDNTNKYLGVNVASPAYNLDVFGSANVVLDNIPGPYLTNKFAVTNGMLRLGVDADPTYGSRFIQFTNTLDSIEYFSFNTNVDGNPQFSMAHASSFSINSGGSNYGLGDRKVIFLASGEVGIGTTTPSSFLHIVGNGGIPIQIIEGDSSATGLDSGQLVIRSASDTTKKIEIGIDSTHDIGFIETYVGSTSTAIPLSINPSGGKVGIGNTNPKVTLHVGNGGGSMGFPYEESIVEKTGDTKFGLYTSTNAFTAGIGAGITLGYTNVTATSGYYPGFEFQHIGSATDLDNYARYNFIQRNSSGAVVGASQDIFNIYASGKVTLNPFIGGTLTTPPVPQFLLGLNTSTHALDINSALSSRISSLGGGGTMMVIVDNDGVLSTQAISGGGGTVTSVGLSMPSAFSVSSSPITTSGTLTVTGAGTTSQLIDGTGALQTIPTSLPPSGTAGGDLQGSYPNPTVHQIQGQAVQNGSPADKDLLIWDNTASMWKHQQITTITGYNNTNWDTAYSSRISTLTTTGSSGSATLASNVLNIPTYTLSGLGGQPQLNGTGFVKASGTTISYDNSTYVPTSRSISTTAPLSGGGDLSADRTLSIAQANGSTNGYLASADWTTMMTQILLTAYQALGSSMKGITLTVPDFKIVTGGALSDGSIRVVPVYVPVSATITGVRWFQATQGNYTADNYNGVGLYSQSGGTITLVASSTNDGNIWKGTTNTWQFKAFTTPFSATGGTTYYIAALYNSSAETTAPTLGCATALSNVSTSSPMDFTNSNRLVSAFVSQTSLASPLTLSSAGTTNLMYGLYLY